MLNFEVILIDNRPTDLIKDKIELADRFVATDDFEQGLKEMNIEAGASYIIATWGHAHDRFALKGALTKKASYIGMIGSKEKIRIMFDILKEEGITQEQLDCVYTPVGLDIGSETPDEIAVSIMAELLMLKNGATGKSMREVIK